MTRITYLRDWLLGGAARFFPSTEDTSVELIKSLKHRGSRRAQMARRSRRGDLKRELRLTLIQGGKRDSGRQLVKARKAERRGPDRPPEPPEAA